MIPQLSFYKYNPTYQGSNLEEQKYAFEKSAEAYNKNLDNYNKLQSFASSIKALPQDREYVQNKIKDVEESIKQISSSVQGNKRWDLAGNVIQQMTAKLSHDPRLNAARESYNNFLQGEKIKQEMRMKGDTPIEFSNFAAHKSFDDEGNINIYNPVIEVKGDYVKAANDIIKHIAPDIIEAKLTPSEIEGLLEGKTIKSLTLDKIRNKLNAVKNIYMSTYAGQQHKKYLQQIDSKHNPDKTIDDFLFGLGSLQTFKEEHTKNIPDPSYSYIQQARLLQQKADEQIRVKRATGRGSLQEGNNNLFTTTKLEAVGNVGESKRAGTALMFKNKELSDGFSNPQLIPDKSQIVPIGEHKPDLETINIDDVSIKGFALDNLYGSSTAGGMIANIDYHDGKTKKTFKAIIKNPDPNITRLFETSVNLRGAINKKDTNKGQGHIIEDTSNLLGFVREIDLGGGQTLQNRIGFRVRPDKKVEAMVQSDPKTNTWRPFNKREREFLGIKELYTPELITDLTIDQLAPFVKPYALTRKDVSE